MASTACLVVILLLSSSACLARHFNGRGGGGILAGISDMAEPRLGINIARIIQLEKHIEHIRDRLEEAHHVDPEQFIHHLEARIDHLEGSHCEDHEFQCGEESECISDLFVCDGHNDCENHHDEDDDVCSTEGVKAGHIFSGHFEWTSCEQREDNIVHINIVSTRKFKVFPGIIRVRAAYESVYDDEHGKEVTRTHQLHGYYEFAHHHLFLFADKDEENEAGLFLRCDFEEGDDERAECYILTVGSEQVCAEGNVALQHLEEEEEDEDHHDDGHHGYYDTTGHEEEHKKDHDDDHHRHRGKHHDDDDDDHHGKKRHRKHHDDDDDHHGKKRHGKDHDDHDDDDHHGKKHRKHDDDHYRRR